MRHPLLFTIALAGTLLLSQGGLRAYDPKAPRKAPTDTKQEDSKGPRSSDPKGPRPSDSKGPRRRQINEGEPRAARRSKEPVSERLLEWAKKSRAGNEAEEAESRAWAKSHKADRRTPEGLFLAWKASILRRDRKAFFRNISKAFRHRYFVHGLESEIRPIDHPRLFYLTMFSVYLGVSENQGPPKRSETYFLVRFKRGSQIGHEILKRPIVREGGEWKIDGGEESARFFPAAIDRTKIPPRPIVGIERKAEIQKQYSLISEAEEAQAVREAKAHKADFSTPQALFATWRASILRRDRSLFLACFSPAYIQSRYPRGELGYIKHLDYLKYFYMALSMRFAKVERSATGETRLWITFNFRSSQTKLLRTQTRPFRVLLEGGRWIFQEL